MPIFQPILGNGFVFKQKKNLQNIFQPFISNSKAIAYINGRRRRKKIYLNTIIFLKTVLVSSSKGQIYTV